MTQPINYIDLSSTRANIDLEALREMSHEISQREDRVQAAEQTLSKTLEDIASAEQKNVNLKSTITNASTITSGSVGYLALSALSAPVSLTLFGALGTAYVTKKIIDYLTRT